MGEPDTKAATAAGDLLTTLAEAYPYGNEPPRLIAAINDTPTDAPEKTKWSKDPSTPATVGAPYWEWPHPVEHVIAPLKDILSNPDVQAEALKQILEWVQNRLLQPMEIIWLTQFGSAAQWATGMSVADAVKATPADLAKVASKPIDEMWARTVSELLFAADYGGPSEMYDMGAMLVKGDVAQLGESWLQYIYRRIERRYPKTQRWCTPRKGAYGMLVFGAYQVDSWKSIMPPTLPEPEKYEGKTPPQELLERFVESATNDDPAVPIVAACQHVATLINLMRGYPLDWMGSATMPAVGLGAADGVKGFPIYGGSLTTGAGLSNLGGAARVVAKPSGGTWYAPKARSDPGPGNWVDIFSKTIVKDQSMVPATIFVWDPNHGVGAVPLSEFENTFINRQARATFMKTRSHPAKNDQSWDTFVAQELAEKKTLEEKSIPAAEKKVAEAPEKLKKQHQNTLDGLKKRLEELKARDPKPGLADDYSFMVPKVQQEWADRIAALKIVLAGEKSTASPERIKRLEKEIETKKDEIARAPKMAADRTRTDRDENTADQLPGSHINAVLRVHASNEAYQVFDTGIGGHLGILKKTFSDSVIPIGGNLTADGYRHPREISGDKSATSHESSGVQVGAGVGNTFGGMGVPGPPPIDIAEHTKWLANARPIGLVRFAVTRRGANLAVEAPLFISALRPMYGAQKTENFTITKLLWSLRNTPGFTDLQPWWLVYVPRGILARAMYAPDGREMTLSDFVKVHGDTTDLQKLRFFLDAEPFSWPPNPTLKDTPKKLEEARKQAFFGNIKAKRQCTLLVALTNLGSKSGGKDENSSGEAHVYTRFKSQEGATQLVADGGGPLGKLKKLAEDLRWYETYPNPLPAAVAQAVPAFFRPGPVPTEADWEKTKAVPIDDKSAIIAEDYEPGDEKK